MSKLIEHYKLYRAFAHSVRASLKLGYADWCRCRA